MTEKEKEMASDTMKPMTQNIPEAKDKSAAATACLICFEGGDAAVGAGALVPLNETQVCTHLACRVCLRYYLIQCENERKPIAICPVLECKEPIVASTVTSILGRDYTPKTTWNAHNRTTTCCQQSQDQDEDDQQQPEHDSELLAWLRFNEAQQCQNCMAWIVHDGGCQSMQCLCGWRFCWECKAPITNPHKGGQKRYCSCAWDVCDFYDNIRGEEGFNDAPKVATAEDLEDFAAFYKKQRQQQQQQNNEDCKSDCQNDDEDNQ